MKIYVYTRIEEHHIQRLPSGCIIKDCVAASLTYLPFTACTVYSYLDAGNEIFSIAVVMRDVAVLFS